MSPSFKLSTVIVLGVKKLSERTLILAFLSSVSISKLILSILFSTFILYKNVVLLKSILPNDGVNLLKYALSDLTILYVIVYNFLLIPSAAVTSTVITFSPSIVGISTILLSKEVVPT